MAAAVEEVETLVPELTLEETEQAKAELAAAADSSKKEESEFPTAPDYPLADYVAEHGLDAHTEEESFYEEIATKDISFFIDMKNMPDAVARKYHPEICRRFIVLERRIKQLEDMLWNLPREDRSLEEDRFEILTEVLDKACHGFEIWDEHVNKRITMGHRICLEARLFKAINDKFDIIEKTCREFHKLKNDQLGANTEREWLRYEIRHADLNFTEIHENFLKSYLEMDW